ncbi:MAG: TlpA family protein disulfide reductase [Tannerella sp.]|jgi:peroxiredoxin|nr:TlpA family protein disulfide reductase [Tannerella sp.]
MLKKLLFIGCILSLLFSCKDKAGYQIKIDLSNLEAQNLYAIFEASDRKSVDTLFCDGSSAIIITQVQEDFRTLTVYFEKQAQWISVYLEPQKTITITGDIRNPLSYQIKGGKINNQLSEFRKKIAPLLKQQTSLIASENSNEQHKEKEDNTSRLANISHEIRGEAESFIKKHPSEEASAILIRDFFSDPDMPGQIDQLLDELDPELDDFYIVKDLRAYSEKAKQTMIGAKVPAFNVRNIYGKIFSEKSYTSRPFIIAFTALWCDMCQTEELLLDEIAATYPEDSLGILLVSLDENPKEVRELIKNDSIKWNIVTDSAGQAIKMLDLFNIKAIPRSFLINKDGDIILKTENGNELKQALSESI